MGMCIDKQIKLVIIFQAKHIDKANSSYHHFFQAKKHMDDLNTQSLRH
jgi:hypothetical protein